MNRSAHYICTLVLLVLTSSFLSSCTQSGSSNTPTLPINQLTSLSIDSTSTVPVLNGTGTQGTLYIHNYTNQTINGVRFSLNQPTFNSQVKSLIAKAGFNLGGGIEDKNGFVLLNSERCIKIAANSSCAINFTTPNLSFGNQGSALVNVNYKLNGKLITNSQVVNYNYVDSSLSTGVNFTGNVDLSGTPGTTKYVVGYLYGGNANGGVYKNVNLVSNNPTATISGGFINSQEVASNQVIAVEYRVAIQSNQKSFINIVPTWGNSVSNISRSNANSGSGAILGIIIDPSQNTANYLFGNVPILKAESGYEVSISVVNNGNGDGTALTATKTGGNTNAITINTDDCTADKLKANADSSCQITYKVNSYTPSSTAVEYKDASNNVVGSQVIYWTNDKPIPAVLSIPTIKNIPIERESDSDDIEFSFMNIGKAPLESMIITPVITGPAQWIVTENTCTSLTAMGVNGSCRVKGHIKSNDNDGIGVVYYMIQGSYDEGSYSFLSIPIRYMVLAEPNIVITPASVVNVTLFANGESVTSNTYIAKNIGNDPALVTNLSLSAMTNTHKPVISGSGTCNGSMILGVDESCSVVVTYGPQASSISINESGSTHVVISYHGGTPDINREAVSESYNYSLVGNDSYVIESISITGFESGEGSVLNPYITMAKNESSEIKIRYTNASVNYPLTNFSINTNDLPYGMTIINSTCPVDKVANIAIGDSCDIAFGFDRNVLKGSSQGGTTQYDFITPTATWTTPFGFYKQLGHSIYVAYLQPTISFAFSLNNGGFESTVLTASLVNANYGTSPFTISISSVNNWLESSPIALSNNCSVNPDYSASCNLTGSSLESTGQINYIMPTYAQQNESTMIPLLYSTASYGYLSPMYSFIFYVVP